MEKADTNADDLTKLVDFCDKYIATKPTPTGKVIHQTECVLTKYPHLNVNCQCFRHNSYVVHGKWFWQGVTPLENPV
jgi:hypothetical protein